MPRIEPIRLLNCLSVLLSPSGGIKCRDVIYPLVGLMTKYSKKLVSKCIYIQILKCTDLELLALFMSCGGWRLVHMWLTESIVATNWPLVRELLELLLLCPVDIERLKSNNNPKLVKELSKDGNHFDISVLASKIVERWLKIVKGEQVTPISITEIPEIIANAQQEVSKTITFESSSEVKSGEVQDDNNVVDKNIENIEPTKEDTKSVNLDNSQSQLEFEVPEKEKEAIPILKLSLKNGKQIISQVDVDKNVKESSPVNEKSKDKNRSKEKSDRRSSSSSSSSKSSSKHSSKSSSHDRHKHKSNRHSDSKEKSRDKDRDKEKTRHSSDSSKSKHSSSSSKKSSSSSRSKDDKKQLTDRVKEELKEEKDSKSEKTVPSIHKLGKIPKLSDVKKDKPSISIEVRKPDEPKPKTVKTFHSKFRTHGLEEEIKPPPSRAAILNNKKAPPALPPTVSIPKRPSPVHNETPPEKKAKTLDISKMEEKPGSIKLIPPKPKPMVLQESDMFMDALNASATNKKEPKKRKRRTSGSKDGNANDGSPPHTPTSITSPNSESKSVPPKFYQDTLDNEEVKDKTKEKTSEEAESSTDVISDSKMETDEPHTLTINGIKGVLCYHKRKGPKKSIKWKPDSELEEVQYFELDETERVNVTKTFTDMKYLDRIHEREAFEKARNLINDDVMEEKTTWKPLVLINVEGQTPVDYGKNSKEKDIQAIRQKGTLQPLYFYKSMIPDSPLEPDPETHTYSEPTIIPLEDVTGNQDNIGDFRNMPWPEPKGNAPPNATTNTVNVAPLFPTNIPQFPNGFPGPQFPGVGNFPGPPIMPGEWPNGVPPMMPNGMPGQIPTPGMPPGPMPPVNLPPGMMVPPDNMMMGPDMFGAPNPMFPVGPDGFNMQQNMFPVDFNMGGPQGPPGPDGFNGPNNFRGAMRGRGSGGWRGKATGNWDMSQRGRGGRGGGRKTVCMYFQRKGSCRQGDNCTFLHPGVNCPF